jgi:hypothetical protein
MLIPTTSPIIHVEVGMFKFNNFFRSLSFLHIALFLCIVTVVTPVEVLYGDVTDSSETMSNHDIAREYGEMISNLVLRLKGPVSSNDVSGRAIAKELYYLRPNGISNWLFNHLDYIGGNVPMTLRGEFWSVEGTHLLYSVLLKTGFQFSEYSNCLFSNKAGIWYQHAMCMMLGHRSAGRYFEIVLARRAETIPNERSRKLFERMVSNMNELLPKEERTELGLRMGIPQWEMEPEFNFESRDRYRSMEHTLFARMKSQLATASTNLFETIATMGFIRSLDAIPVLADNLTICPQAATNAPGEFVFPAAEALISIGPAIGDCFARLKATKPLSVEEALWLRISHELYPEGLEYELYCAAQTNDLRAARLMKSLPWRRLSEDDMKDP